MSFQCNLWMLLKFYIQHMWPQALCVPSVEETLCVYCLCSKPGLSCSSSMSGCFAQCCWLIYNSTDYSNKDYLQCTHWHTFFLSSLPSICHYLFIPTCTCFLSPKSQLLPSPQLNALLNALFPSVCFHYPSLLPLFLLSLSVSLWLHPKIPSYYSPSLRFYFSFSLFHCPLYQSPSICPHHLSLSFSRSLSPSGLQLKYYKCYCILAKGQISKAINQYSERIM